MLLVRLLILVVLLGIFIQDIKSRSVYWILFPALSVLFIVSDLIIHKPLDEAVPAILYNLVFLGFQLLIITCWFSIKAKCWVNISADLLGWGDILFLISISFYLSFVNFLFFHIFSLLFALTGWVACQFLANNKSKHIPLAGLQALALTLFLSADWYIFHMDTTNDYWLLHFMIK